MPPSTPPPLVNLRTAVVLAIAVLAGILVGGPDLAVQRQRAGCRTRRRDLVRYGRGCCQRHDQPRSMIQRWALEAGTGARQVPLVRSSDGAHRTPQRDGC